jgi:hypothetical protein
MNRDWILYAVVALVPVVLQRDFGRSAFGLADEGTGVPVRKFTE